MRELLQSSEGGQSSREGTRPRSEGGRKGTPLLYTNEPDRLNTMGKEPQVERLDEVKMECHSTKGVIRQQSLKGLIRVRDSMLRSGWQGAGVDFILRLLFETV